MKSPNSITILNDRNTLTICNKISHRRYQNRLLATTICTDPPCRPLLEKHSSITLSPSDMANQSVKRFFHNHSYVRDGDLCSARRLLNEMFEKNIATWNTMIDGYARLGNVGAAELLFNEMPAKDIISWTTMITCYSQNKQFREALYVFNDMKTNGFSPDEVTISSVISACAHLGALDLGKEMHLYLMQNGFNLDVYIGSALIDMYAKCGSLDRSLSMFFKLQEKNLFFWNSIIEGPAVHGFSNKALAMFDRMETEKINPNGVTFISILSACTHAGLVKEGLRRFQSMTHKYSISPDLEHYGCMADLLSKAGLLGDALELI